MTQPGADTTATVQAIQDNAHRLGLTWEIQYATVTDGTNPGVVIVTFDGDALSVPTPAVSLIGSLAAGQRVAVLSVPPDGAYVVGYCGRRNQLGVRLRRVANQTINSGAPTTISWDTEDEDTSNFWTASNPTVITIPETALYSVTYRSHLTVTGVRNFCSILLSSTVTGQAPLFRESQPTGEDVGTANCVVPLIAGDSITCDLFQNGAGASQGTAWFYCFKVGDWVA